MLWQVSFTICYLYLNLFWIKAFQFRTPGTLHEDQYAFWLHILSVLLRMRTVSTCLKENRNTHTIFLISCRFWHTVENIAEPDRPQLAIWRKRIASCITKTTSTHSEYVIFTAFPRQHWFHKHPKYYVILTLHVLLFFKWQQSKLGEKMEYQASILTGSQITFQAQCLDAEQHCHYGRGWWEYSN